MDLVAGVIVFVRALATFRLIANFAKVRAQLRKLVLDAAKPAASPNKSGNYDIGLLIGVKISDSTGAQIIERN